MAFGVLADVLLSRHEFTLDESADDGVEIAGHVEHAGQEQTLDFRVGQQKGKHAGRLVLTVAPLEDGTQQPRIGAEKCVVEAVDCCLDGVNRLVGVVATALLAGIACDKIAQLLEGEVLVITVVEMLEPSQDGDAVGTS